ncbi:MAG TPA: hypothetical protein VG206_11910 [Terriglobia bacterium]|nr:hypothetical protein [Terriglobia bacterium]
MRDHPSSQRSANSPGQDSPAGQTTEITYDPVQFKQVASALWLPTEVDVTLQWAGKTYRDTHRYSAVRLFNTDTEEKVSQTNLPAEP